MNRFFFNEPHGTIRMVMVPPWNDFDFEKGTLTIPGGLMSLLFIVQYANPPANHYWTGRFNGTLGAGNSRFEFAAKATGSEFVAFHNNKPVRNEARGLAFRWTSATEGELGLPANTIDVFVGTPAAPMTRGTPAVVANRPTPIATGGRVQFNTFGARVAHIDSTADVLPDEKIVAWWNELRGLYA